MVSVAAVILANASFALVPMAGRRFGLWSGETPVGITVGAFVAIAVLGVLLVLLIWRRAVIRILRNHLNIAGIPVCLGCGYRLHGLLRASEHPAQARGIRCPECGGAHEPPAPLAPEPKGR